MPATFQRRDGVALPIVPGFRNRILSYRESVTPKDTWTTQEYEAAAEKKRARFKRLMGEAARWRPSLNDVAVLDVGCGDGTNTLLFGLEPVREAVGIDLRLPLFSPDMHGEWARRFVTTLLRGGQGRDRPKGGQPTAGAHGIGSSTASRGDHRLANR